MTFSYNYERAMRRMTSPFQYVRDEGYQLNDVPSPIIATCELTDSSYEVPVCMEENIQHIRHNTLGTVVAILPVTQTTSLSGVESILKNFSRPWGVTGLIKNNTPKGEICYGAPGLIFDENLTPLFYVTHTISKINGSWNSSSTRTVHFNSSVFTDDTKAINKHLARKAFPFYLQWGAKTVIDDGSRFFRKINLPNIATFSDKNITKLLQDNIDEVLIPMKNDITP